jgi:hypothetical protein
MMLGFWLGLFPGFLFGLVTGIALVFREQERDER